MFIDLLIKNPLLLLFLVAAIGFPIGRIHIKGGSLGVSAVLFVGLFAGALHPELKVPELLSMFGLTLFVYTIGLSSGPAFFSSFRRKGLRETAFVISLLVGAAILTVAAMWLFKFDSATASGIFAGSLNNTPALAGVLDQLKSHVAAGVSEVILTKPVVGYSLTYPMGVLGTILAIYFAQKLWRIDYSQEKQVAAGAAPGPSAHGPIRNRTILVTQQRATIIPIQELARQNHWEAVFGRYKHDQKQQLVSNDTRLSIGDEVVVIAPTDQLDLVTSCLGQKAEEDLSADRSLFDYRRVFVSNKDIIGRRLGELDFMRSHEIAVTRIRRGDVELLPHPNMVLEPGDRIRVLCRREIMDEVSAYFGDSYKAVSEIDILSFSTGLALGILFGLIPFPLASGIVVKFGLAGGPLVVGLILGKLYRTGSIVWVLPYGATLMIRQIGLVLFLAGVGTRAGYAFFSTILHGPGLLILLVGTAVSLFTVFGALVIGYRVLGVPMSRLVGMIAGMFTQPAVLGFALEQTRNENPNAGYAMVHPIATITKIILAQIVLSS